VRYITEREKQIIIAAFSDLENLINQYREAVMWLTFGNLEATGRPIKQATRQRLKELRKEIVAVLKDIELKA
jgi:ABC-type polysaccharide/polyol phosphate transport system ATPase subunit